MSQEKVQGQRGVLYSESVLEYEFPIIVYTCKNYHV
jgi:hypothetical protein